MLTPHTLTCEYFTNPLGIDVRQPRLSWKSRSSERNARQTAYQIQVVAADDKETVLWDTDKVASDQSLHVVYDGAALQPGQRCSWRVRVWDANEEASDWSEAAWWEIGLLDNANWQADWISPDWEEDASASAPAPLLRRAFRVADDLATARIYATSLGLYELHLNGQRVGDALLTPGWTSYDHRILYQTYDVTDLLREGDNALGATLGDGWYRGFLGFQRQRNMFGERLALLLQLHLTYADGRVEIVSSDDKWRAAPGPIISSDIYMGETYDAREERTGWNKAGFDDSSWSGVRRLDHSKKIVVAQDGPLIRRHEELRPKSIFRSPNGETILDFGQNMVGWVRVHAKGPAGTTITIRHAEVLDQEGNFYTENLRSATQVNRFTLKGAPHGEIFEPRFTFQGFQFIAVEGYPGEPTLDDFTGIVVHSDTPPTGSFACSNPLINQLQHNIIWGQKGNFVDVPTDCPQRDERLGWTGDAQAFIRTACFNMNVGGFFTKWLRDLKADQLPDGSVTFVVPDVLARPGPGGVSMFGGAGAAAWSDAGVICPWTIYLCYGDTRLLEEQYDSMVGWVEYIRNHADEDRIWRKGFQFGDWLDFRGHAALIPSPVTNNELVGTAFFAYSADLLANAARMLGKTDDAERYTTLANEVKTAFTNEFVTANGRVGPNSQTAYVLALHFDLLPEALRPLAAERLAEEVRKANYHLTTGFVGTPYLCHVLSRFGYTDIAYELLNQESFPSWLYPVNRGATTIWERWDGIKPDGSFQDAAMNSFNHYAYGAIGEWLYRVVAGLEIDADAPGYKHVLVQPQPGGGLTSVQASLETPYGPLSTAWELSDNDFQLEVSLPPNTHATVRLPAPSLDAVSTKGKALATGDGINNIAIVDGVAVIEIGSGSYTFATTGLNLAQTMAKVRHIAGRLDRTSTLRDLLDNERAKALLSQYLNMDFLDAPVIGMTMDRPLEQLALFAPELLPAQTLDAIEQQLIKS